MAVTAMMPGEDLISVECFQGSTRVGSVRPITFD